MPINKPELQKHTRMFTQQDFLDGKCTKEGFPLDKGAKVEPHPKPTSQFKPSPAADETQSTEAVKSEDNVDASGQPNPPETKKEGE